MMYVNETPAQQLSYVGYWDMDGSMRRRRFRDFNIRDILRLLFLRELFDRDRRY